MRILLGQGRRGWGLMLIAISLFAAMLYTVNYGNTLFAQEDPEKKTETTEPATDTTTTEKATEPTEPTGTTPDTSEAVGTTDSGLPPDAVDVNVTEKGDGEKASAKEGDIRGSKKTMSLWDQFRSSGWCGFVIFLIEIAVLTFVIESFVSVNVNKVMPTDLTLDLEGKLNKDQNDVAIETCYENPTIMTNVLRAGLEAPKDNLDEAKDCIDMAGEQESEGFLHRINYLSVFGMIAPMFGLLGTVIGMVTCFGNVASESALGKPEKLAAGINLALLTTEYGLIVGIPAMFMYYFFKMRANRILMAVESGVKSLIRWRAEGHKGLPPLGLFPSRMLIAVNEALNDGFLSLIPVLGFLLGPLSIAKGLRIKDEISNALTAQTIPVENAENPGTDNDAAENEQRRIIITPEVSASLWKASAAVLLGIIGIVVGFASLGLLIYIIVTDVNPIQKLWYSGINN
jgi:biopolymer transport protein ExbB